ncbi:MAG: hypothetical protein WBG42_14965 [Cryomorphaceae bacterium]
MKSILFGLAVVAMSIFVSCGKVTENPTQAASIAYEQKSQYWFSNSQNQGENSVFNALVRSFDYANTEGKKLLCSNNLDSASIEWITNFDEKFHELYTFNVDPNQLSEDSLSQEWADKLAAAYFINDPRLSIDSIVSLENQMLIDYPYIYPNRHLEFNGLLQFSATLKMTKYLFSSRELNVCNTIAYDSFNDFLGLSDDPYDDCMRRKINNAGLFEIIINYGAGPGGWVAVASADCVVEILMSE